ncbi:SseB family protein [Streptomyces sioyaensis]|uniref:SseB family protein n=1 Tax=Streptomyces sioyaensis TaxID=67364 RepID=UPI0037AE7BAC
MSSSSPDDHAPPTEASATEGTPSAEEAAETQAALIDIATSVALLPQSPPADGEEPPEGAIALPVVEQDGNRYVPVFTTEDALLAAGGEPGAALRVPVVDLAANWPADDLWLAVNPSTEGGLVLPPDLVRALPAFSRGNGQAEEPGPGRG